MRIVDNAARAMVAGEAKLQTELSNGKCVCVCVFVKIYTMMIITLSVEQVGKP